MTDRTITAQELDRYERAIAEIARGLGLSYIDAAYVCAVDLRRAGWLFIFEVDGGLISQYLTNGADVQAALWAERHLFAVDLTTPTKKATQ